MNRVNYDQTEGFPVDANVLDFHQNATQIFNKFGELAGNCSIISGCVETGENVSDGVVYVNGEAFDFKGGQKTEFVIIRQTAVNLPFENGAMKPVEITRFVTFGNDGVTNIPWANFKKPKTLLELTTGKGDKEVLDALVKEVVELKKKTAIFDEGGGMFLFRKPANLIPPGFREVVDWRERLPMGWNPDNEYFNTLGKTGGSKTATIGESNLPSFSIPYKDIYYSEYWGTVNTPTGYGSGSSDNGNKGYEMDRTANFNGQQLPLPVLNPYRLVMFIEYVG